MTELRPDSDRTPMSISMKDRLLSLLTNDFGWLCVLALLAVIPFRDGFLRGEVVGAGPDVISTLWGMWWLQQEGLGAIFGSETELVNFPYGATGIVLSPTSALTWGLLEPICGVGLALALVNWMQITGIAWGMLWLESVTYRGLGMVLRDCRCSAQDTCFSVQGKHL